MSIGSVLKEEVFLCFFVIFVSLSSSLLVERMNALKSRIRGRMLAKRCFKKRWAQETGVAGILPAAAGSGFNTGPGVLAKAYHLLSFVGGSFSAMLSRVSEGENEQVSRQFWIDFDLFV